MTYSKLGSDGTLSEQSDPRTGKAIPIFIPTLDPTGKEIPVYLHKSSRLKGTYIIGLQGMGKSGLLEELILQDIKQEIGVCLLDPHGELIDHVIARLPDEKKEKKVIHLDLAENRYFFGLNLFACPDPTSDDEIIKVVNQVTHVFEKAFGISMDGTPRIYDYLFNSAYTLIANAGYALIDMPLLFTDACRQHLLANVSSPEVLKFWDDVKQLPLQKQTEEAREVLRRLNDLSHAPLRYIVGQSASTIDLRRIMDEGKILLVKLDRRLEKATKLVGSIIVAQILSASASRQARGQFHLYADEFQNFATEDFAVLLEEARKSGIGITMAHQNRAQLELSDTQADKNLKTRTLNVGNIIVFRVPTDAEELAKQFKAVPKAPEMIEKPARVPKVDVLYHLLEHGHPNSDVMGFVNTYLRPIFQDKDKVDERITVSSLGRSIFPRPPLLNPLYRVFFDDFRDFLIEVMKENNPTLPLPKTSALLVGFFLDSNFEGAEHLRRLAATYEPRDSSGPSTEIHQIFWRLLTSPDPSFGGDRELNKVIAYLVQPDRAGDEYLNPHEVAKTCRFVEKMYISLRRMLRALVVEPIMVETGRYTREPGPEETIANARARVAEGLVNLPQYTARVKLSDGSGNTVEHTIQTYPPGRGLYGQALEARIENIRHQNINATYLRERAKVEAEISNRQTQYRHREPPQAQPPAARKAIPCSSCGFSNPIGSKFCNQCGKPLI